MLRCSMGGIIATANDDMRLVYFRQTRTGRYAASQLLIARRSWLFMLFRHKPERLVEAGFCDDFLFDEMLIDYVFI